MKKILILFLILLTCGCTIVRINTDNLDTIIEVILTNDNNLYNRTGRGYKYYVPRGVSYIDTEENNDKLYSNGNYYYLYVDTISYYKNIDIAYEKRDNIYYSRKLTKDEGFKYNGYVNIEKKKNLYYITFLYNYAKMEAVVSKNNINNAILNIAYILSTIQYNEKVIDLTMDKENYNREEKYEVFKNKVLKDTEV